MKTKPKSIRPLLRKFCYHAHNEFQTRFDISKPFVQDGYEFFTDGCVAVWIPTWKPDSKDRKLPPPGWQIAYQWPTQFEPLANVYVEHRIVRDIFGKDHKCVIVQTKQIQRRYWNLIIKLPNVQIGTNRERIMPLQFRFDGGEGVVMQIGRGD